MGLVTSGFGLLNLSGIAMFIFATLFRRMRQGEA
jgi:hypothetical protein